MRRALTAFLILLSATGPLLAALPGSEEAGLPACCRRLGAHHCAMMMAMERAAGQPAFAAPMHCPLYPGTAPAVMNSAHAQIVQQAAIPALQAASEPIESASSASASRPGDTYAGRGPPASFLS